MYQDCLVFLYIKGAKVPKPFPRNFWQNLLKAIKLKPLAALIQLTEKIIFYYIHNA